MNPQEDLERAIRRSRAMRGERVQLGDVGPERLRRIRIDQPFEIVTGPTRLEPWDAIAEAAEWTARLERRRRRRRILNLLEALALVVALVVILAIMARPADARGPDDRCLACSSSRPTPLVVGITPRPTPAIASDVSASRVADPESVIAPSSRPTIPATDTQ